MKKMKHLCGIIMLVGLVVGFTGRAEALPGSVIEILRPNAPGDFCCFPWASVPCPNHYQCLADDTDSTQVWGTSTPGYQYELYNISDYSAPGGTISGITVYSRNRRSEKDKYGSSYTARPCADILIGTGSNVYDASGVFNYLLGASGFIPAITYTTYSASWENNPQSGAPWTWEDINNLQIGIALRRAAYSGIGIYSYCSQMYVEVDYISGVIPEPTSLLLLGFGVFGIAMFRKFQF